MIDDGFDIMKGKTISFVEGNYFVLKELAEEYSGRYIHQLCDTIQLSTVPSKNDSTKIGALNELYGKKITRVKKLYQSKRDEGLDFVSAVVLSAEGDRFNYRIRGSNGAINLEKFACHNAKSISIK